MWNLADVRFKNNGLDLIEVQDNGGGIAPENYEGLGAFIHFPRMLIFGASADQEQHSSTTRPNSRPTKTSQAYEPSVSAAKHYPHYAPSPTSTLSQHKPNKPLERID